MILRNARCLILAALCLCVSAASAQLAVTISPVKAAASKAVVPLEMKNSFAEKIESARASVFLVDQDGKIVGQATRWVIGGSKDKPGLAPGATNVFNFVIATDQPATTTNLTAKVSFNRVILEGGRAADVTKEVIVTPVSK
jgi:hypothetical protein